MRTIKIKAIRCADYKDLQREYENPIEHTCDIKEGDEWEWTGGERPEGICGEAWNTLRPFAEKLLQGEGHFYGNWMKDPYSAMLSCNDGFRPVSFLITMKETT